MRKLWEKFVHTNDHFLVAADLAQRESHILYKHGLFGLQCRKKVETESIQGNRKCRLDLTQHLKYTVRNLQRCQAHSC